ncbi:hypothetical protein FQA39_LY02111 [Lamprigera yunnana]|nr:hypothetical protein FQA39_LY02111 [Lamprigera yunnana]
MLLRPQSEGKCRFVSNNFEVKERNNKEYQLSLRKYSIDLFPKLNKNFINAECIKWPIECQILNERIKHIQYVPPKPEPYYKISTNVPATEAVNPASEKVVYQHYISCLSCFYRAGVNNDLNYLSKSPNVEEDTLRFESRFESGNLVKATKLSSSYYQLYLRNDLYTTKQRHWFYFRITNMKKNTPYRFSIVNMTKEVKLYKEGLKPLIYSEKHAATDKIGWKRCGEDISYTTNESPNNVDSSKTFTLTFTLNFPFDDDQVYLAYCYPYTYSDLQEYLYKLLNRSDISAYTTVRVLCKTLAGNDVHYVTITDNSKTNSKKAIVISARVHPAETPSSWMMKGFIDFLTSNNTVAKNLRAKFIFKLIPMLNPDGVIVGNSWCSLSGKNLLTQRKDMLQKRYPTVWYTKLMLERYGLTYVLFKRLPSLLSSELSEKHGVLMFCDLRAYDASHDVLVYGDDDRKSLDTYLNTQHFSSVMQKKANDKFIFRSTKYSEDIIDDTAASFTKWMMDRSNMFTIKTSVGGSATSEVHYGTQDYEEMAHIFCKALLECTSDSEMLKFNLHRVVPAGVVLNISENSIIRTLSLPEIDIKLHKDDDYLTFLLEKSYSELFPLIGKHNTDLLRVKWPMGYQILHNKIQHIRYIPSSPEPYYVATGLKLQPTPFGNKCGKVVYQYSTNSSLNDPNLAKDCLRFESRFENGNLAKAVKIDSMYYELYLRNDFYSCNHKQWYYFKVTNMKTDVNYREMEKESGVQTYVLTFIISFPYNNDEVYFAYCYPYTYSDLQNYLQKLHGHPTKSRFTNIRILYKTFVGNNVYMVTIDQSESKEKKVILISARLHPVETPSSWMMKGFLEFLTGDSETARKLRKQFVFILIPMLNPDGVIVGNTHHCIIENALNQSRNSIRRRNHPVWYIQLLIRKLAQGRNIALFCDLHAQCTKNNVFVSGINEKMKIDNYRNATKLSTLLSNNGFSKFSFETGQVDHSADEKDVHTAVWKMGVSNSFTLEVSFGGSSLHNNHKTHFHVQDYEQMGQLFCKTIWDICVLPNEVRQHNCAKFILLILVTFHGARVKVNKKFVPYNYYSHQFNDSLTFESRFECGNLSKAVRISEFCYELFLRNDLYTIQPRQWYYFSVSNMKKDMTYRFSIVNMTQRQCLYSEGMKPLMYSQKEAFLRGIGWKRCGDNIAYYCNDMIDEVDQGLTYTLTFVVEFPYDNDTVYFAYSYPYSYTDLQNYLTELSSHPTKSQYATVRLLCKTLAGNNLYCVTITGPKQDTKPKTKLTKGRVKRKEKRVIIITARVNPSDTPSSWIMKGFMDFLTDESNCARLLREFFIFKLVPMLNPDGVVVGNTRCSLSGKDLNGEFKTESPKCYPTIWYTKLLTERMLDKHEVTMFCDLHAQYSMHNVVVYGCDLRTGLNQEFFKENFLSALQKTAPDTFVLENSNFNNKWTQASIPRIVMCSMGVRNSFTMEASFGGSTLGDNAEIHFRIRDYEEIAHTFCQSLLEFFVTPVLEKKIEILMN